MPYSIANTRLTLLHESLRRVEVAPEVVDLVHRRNVGVTQAQIESQFLAHAIIILEVRCVRFPFLVAVRVAGKDESSPRGAAEELRQVRGLNRITAAARLSPEVDPAPDGVRDGVGNINVREFAAKLPGVLAHQEGKVVLEIVIPVTPVLGTVMPGAEFLKTGQVDIRESAHTRHSGVDGVARATGKACAIGKPAGIVGQEIEEDLVIAKPDVVHQAGIGGPNPVSANRVRAYQVWVDEDYIQHGMVYPGVVIVVDHHQAVDRVLVVDVIVDLRNPVVGDVSVGESGDVVRTGRRRVVGEQAASAGVRSHRGWRASAASYS